MATATEKGRAGNVTLRRLLVVAFSFILTDLTAVGAAHGFRHGLKQAQRSPYSLNKSLKNSGLFPSTFNVAAKADIYVNATCGEEGPETFCKPSESSRCAVCDSRSPDPGKRHNISNILDLSPGKWWQSPTLARGDHYEYVTILLDLKQIYQVEYVIVKAANSPRPAAWILERSLDGENFQPWQYYAPSDGECWTRYSAPPVAGKPVYIGDDEVICTSQYSRQTPMENGEIHTHLVNGRPGALNHSATLQEFTQARFVRLRLQGLRRNGEAVADKRRAFYSIKEINIGGRCLCSGHAARCRYSVQHGHQECECERHTCGERCEKCCPMYNQIPWKPGTAGKGFHCEKCNCNGHATSCMYDQEVAERRMSMDIRGKYRGGGVCVNCSEHTTGINCEKCEVGYYRPNGVAPDASEPCLPCDCNIRGSTGYCTPDDSYTRMGKVAGACECKPGYSGYKCDQCAAGYRQFPDCMPCPCDSRGILPSHDCEGDCLCKANVAGDFCDRCVPRYFALTKDNLDGCMPCYCFDVADHCTTARLTYSMISTLENWLVTDMNASRAVVPILDTDNEWLTVAAFDVEYDSPFWLAPQIYTGNRVSSYGSNLTYSVTWVVMRGDTSGKPTTEPNVILVGNNGMRIAYGEEQYSGQEAEIAVPLREQGWFHVRSDVQDIPTRLRRTEFRGEPVTRTQLMRVLADLKYLMIRARYHSEQIEGSLQSAILTVGELSPDGETDNLVEMCECPEGYTGTSCEKCAWGYVKMPVNGSGHQDHHVCVKCDCNGHAGSCDLAIGECGTCEHHTVGPKCGRCATGYYGIATRGTSEDCKKCACPLSVESNNFSPSCQLDNPVDMNSGYVCTQCPEGYAGDHCETCDIGFYGNPLVPGGTCERCPCNGGACDQETGRCLECRGNTEGWKCEKCKEAHFGNPLEQNCMPCNCSPFGSNSIQCDQTTGQCPCGPLFTGRDCSFCIEGYGNVTAGCRECDCDVGAIDGFCDSVSGVCRCAPGVVGFRCDRCDVDHYGLSADGCKGLAHHSRGSCSRHDRCPVGQDGLPSDYGVEMYPGRSIWVWGVLALGAGTLLLSGLQWWIESTVQTEGGGSTRSNLIDESKSDGPSVFERPATKEGASYASTDEIIFEPREIKSDRRWKRSTRLDSRNDGSMIEDVFAETSVIYEQQSVSPSIGVDDRKINGDGLSQRNLRLNEDDSALNDFSLKQDQHPVIIRTNAHLNIEPQVSDENKPGRLTEREGQRNKKDSARAMIDVVTSSALRNDRFEGDIVVKTGSRSKSKVDDRRGSRIDVVGRNARAPRSREANINVDNYLRSSTLMLRHIQDSKSTDNHRVTKIGASASKSGVRKGILGIGEKNARPDDQYKSFDPHILRTTGAIMEIEEEITPAFPRSMIKDRDIRRPDEPEEIFRSSSGKQAMILGSMERNTAEGDARRFAAGMQEDQLLFFREDRERVQSSAMSPAEAIHDRKNWPGERDRGDPARKRRETSHNWFTRTSNRLRNFREHDNGVHRKKMLEKSIIHSNEQNDENNNYKEQETVLRKDDRSQKILSKDLNSSVDNRLRNESNDEESSNNTNAFQFLDSIIPLDNKIRKVTRGEDSKDLMVTSNFVWTSQDQATGNRALVPEHWSTFSQDNRRTSYNGFPRKRIRFMDRRKDARGYRGWIGEMGLAAFQKADQRETANGDRRKRYANYYSTQSVTPMAYVHIQPAYPAAPPTNRKCVRCMVLYKPCPSQSRTPPRIVHPGYKYNEPATKWRGLKYGCGCNAFGSMSSACDIVSGQCQCKSHVVGRQCNECKVGYWGLTSGGGCTSCGCDSMGSYNTSCHNDTGECHCKPGVGGSSCDNCLSGYYGFSQNGCQLCDSCVRPGHVCDPDTGRCVCPRLTYGEHCDRCRPGAWDLVPRVGCRPCACTLGATRSQCDHQGQCPCRIGYDGLRCERCAKGYYGYPRCRPCGCNLSGTTHCRDGVCECDDKGQCPCKELAIGRQCNQCKEGTFGLAANNVRGCTECFCFGRSTLCQQARLSWGQRRLTRPRVLYINDTVNDVIISNFGSTTVLPAVNGGLNVTNGLSVIPGSDGDVTLPTTLYYSYPLYWRLPDSFLGDKVVSYGGFLRFKTSTEGGIPLRSNLRYPVVQLQGNNKIVLEYYLHLPVSDNHYEVRFHESLWQLQNRPDYKVSREVLMVALQNLQYILIKASDNAEFTKTTLLEASLDAAVLMPTHSPPLATGVEICQCPLEYNGTSCQDPSIGFYRWYKNTTATSTIVIDLVGQARRCQCNGRSEVCDRETGYCLNCKENTVGSHCNVCADSFYGHPELGGCKPCPCPQVDKRFSSTCVVRADNEPICHCKPGYIGRKCERCAYGYYGSPGLPDGKCIPCNCNLAGSLSDGCDGETGQCKCRVGSTGRDCSQCTAYRHVYINDVCTSCDDNCTGILLDTVAMLSEDLADGTGHIADGYIPPPWEELSYIDSNVTVYLEELELRTRLQQRMRNQPWHEYKKFSEDVEIMLRNMNKLAKHADTLKTQSGDLKNNVFTAQITLNNLKKDIEDTTSELNQYSNDNRRIEVKKALKTAKAILNYLKSVDIAKRTTEVENFLDDVTKYVAWLNSIYDVTEPLAAAQDDAKDYEIKLDDMRTVIENTMETLFNYDSLYNHINGTFIEAKNQCARIGTLHDETNETLTEGKKLIDEARGLLVDAENNIQDLPDSRDKLTYWTEKLSMKEELLYRLNYEYDEKYVVPAVQHAKNLSNYVDQYVSLFAETRDIAASPLKASQAYKNIVDGLQAARTTALAAKETAESVHKKAFPPSGQRSFLDDANEVLTKSSQQWEMTKKHGRLVKNANAKLDAQRQAVLVLKDTLNSTGIKDNEINVKLRELKSNSKKLHEDLLDILDDNDEVAESVKNTQRLIDDYKQSIADRLKPKLHDLKRDGDSKISLANEKLSEALSNIKRADAKLISLSNAAMKRKAVFDKWNDTLATKLQNLKDKIAEARNTAEGIRVSLRSVEGKECIRSYRPTTLQPSSTTSIVITFALPTARMEGSLFYLPSGINDDFIALEIFDKKVRFLWNVGGGTGILTHPEILESGDLQNDKFWYRIEAERTRHTGKLNVHKQSSTSGKYLPVINMTNSEYGRFDVLPTDRVWIGGIPKSQRRPTELIAGNGLPGCIHQVILDGRQIGLWNFITTAPDMACKACVEGVEDARDDIAYNFNGEGYAVRNRVSSGPYNKYMFGVSISFRTYDENALLFLAINKDNNQHIMIFLREGRVILHVGYGGNVSMEMSSTYKYNTGNWTKVDAFRQYQVRKNIEKCSLSIGGDNDKRIGAPTPQPKKEDIPDLAQAKYYIGGLPPSFRAEKLMLPSQVSFLGCMANIIVQEGYDPMAEQYYGVESSCGTKPLKIVGFYGDGYLEHSAFTLRKIQSVISFSFRTMQDAAMLLLSTFEGHEDRLSDNPKEAANRNNYYSVCILNGQVQVRLNGGRGQLVLQSNNTFNDGKYHSITVIKKRKEVELRIDDAYQTSGRLPRNTTAIKAPNSNGGLFFGGLPALINNTKMVATNTPLYGAIKDVIFNDQNLQFDDAVNFDHALIGRPGPSMGKDIETPSYAPSASLSRGMSTQPEGCQKVPYYSLEPGALKFGDKPHSHTQLYLNFKKFWEKKYTIEFDFRTYYPNGLLFITPGLRLKNYLMVLIRDGQLLLVIKNKQRKEILFKTPFNDGNWHHVVIAHEERKLTLLVDTQTPHVLKVPRRSGLASMMYIGGLPESGTPIPEQVVVRLETLKGCIRGLKINGNVYDMVGSTSRAFNVGQCFPSVESGAYFQGEAYAIYRNNFEVDGVLELQLEFRTSEVSGVLLSITASSGSPSLSLELNSGKVIMSGDMGDNNPLYVEQGFASHYAICDNQWHRIQAVYNDEELALKVDELDQRYGLPTNVNYHFNSSIFSGPLYIGGIPATAQKGSLLTRDHFNGCIRNVMIRGERRDWTDMAELHNIHLSSCPVQ